MQSSAAMSARLAPRDRRGKFDRLDQTLGTARYLRPSPSGHPLLAIAAEIDAPDGRRFRVRLTELFPQILYALGARGCYIIPRKMAMMPANQPIKWLIGSSPFRFVTDERVSGVWMVYAHNDRYQPRQEPANTKCRGCRLIPTDGTTDPWRQRKLSLRAQRSNPGRPTGSIVPGPWIAALRSQ